MAKDTMEERTLSPLTGDLCQKAFKQINWFWEN